MNNIQKKRIKIVLPIFIVALLVIAIAATLYQKKLSEENQYVEEINVIVYGEDGKTDGSKLQSEPIKITDEYVYYQDRIVKRFHFDDEEIDEYTNVVHEILTYIPDDIEKNFILIPSRIMYEDIEYTDDKENFVKTYEEITGHLENDIKVFDVYDVLKEHEDEYIYFRTDEVWTALGAYYAAQYYLQNYAVDIYPIESYHEDKFSGYVGTMWAAEGGEYIFQSPDYVSFYTMQSIKNKQMITAYENSEYVEFESPVIAVSRMGTDIFMGGIFSHSIIEGDGNNAKSLMIIGDKNAKLFAPWLIPYYETICVVDPAYYEEGHDEFEDLIEQLKTTEFLIITSMNTLDNDVRMDRIRYLTEDTEQEATED